MHRYSLNVPEAIFGTRFHPHSSHYGMVQSITRQNPYRLSLRDFRQHAIAYLLAELYERHDRSRFEVIGISLGEDDGSEMRARLIRAFDQFHDVCSQSDLDVARLLYSLEVDIVVDINGHTRRARPEILSYRPCPVQVNYLGYPGTMGADFIDYIIADDIVLPTDQAVFFTEKIVRLPDCYQANDSKRAISTVTPARQKLGLPEAGFVFCCFNNNWKISEPVFDIWMRLLGSVPGSVLWLIEDSPETKKNLLAEATARGVDPQRLIFAPRVKLEDHLAVIGWPISSSIRFPIMPYHGE